MKLEKLSDNQIRCTLNRADLAERELKISELAYGTEKAKDLFREMMQQASFEFGFEAEDIPLMIEAIPVSADCIILIITKVEDPEELDTRFSKFAPSRDEDDAENLGDAEEDDIASLFSKIQEIRDSLELSEDDIEKVEQISGATENNDDFIPFKDALKKVQEAVKTSVAHDEPSHTAPVQKITRIFKFNSFEKVNQACNFSGSAKDTTSALYKDTVDNRYYLVLTLNSDNTDEYNRICNSISEFGSRIKVTYATESYYKEHFETLISQNALSILENL